MSNRAITIEELPTIDHRSAPDLGSQERSSAKAARITSTPPGRPRRKLLWLLATAVAISATALAAYILHASKFEATDNAFVEADVHPISSRVSGDVLEVLVIDNQIVEKGQPLARLDARDFEVNLKSAQAALDQASAQLPSAEAALDQARAAAQQAVAQMRTSEAQLAKARLDLERAVSLRSGPNKVISQQDLDNAKTALEAAEGNTEGAQAARDAAVAGVRNAEANLKNAFAGKERAQTAVENAKLQLSYTTLVAPEAGRIAKKTLQTGQHIQPGQSLMAVVAPERWIVANFKENQLTEMHAGQSVEITIDAIHGHAFRGRVDSFAPGTGAKFTLLPPDNATGNFTKIVQRVPVKILLDAQDTQRFEDRLVVGLSATATVRLMD